MLLFLQVVFGTLLVLSAFGFLGEKDDTKKGFLLLGVLTSGGILIYLLKEFL